MNLKKITTALLLVFIFTKIFSLNPQKTAKGNNKDSIPDYKFSASTSWFIIDNIFSSEELNISMYELRLGYVITPKDKIEIKACTWRLFEPMGIPFWDPLLMKESEWYPGKIREYGIGIGYLRFWWKGLYTSIEILPLIKKYMDNDKNKIDNGFKLYTTYHLGYHISLFKNRFFLEPQIHYNYWPIDTKGPQGFEEKESRWNNYFLFEPNIYFGVKF